MVGNVPLNIESLILTAFASILGVAAFWFLQLILIELQKRTLSTLRHHHEAFCRFTNYIGILFQSISQALGYTITRSGIASFQMTVTYGKVEPKKEKKGVFEWIARSFLLFGPFFIPAGLVLLISYFVIGKGFVFPIPVQYTFVESITEFWNSLSIYASEWVGFFNTIDFFNPIHIGFFVMLLFFGLGIRPSYIGQERKEKIDILYDLRHIKEHLFEKPRYLLIIVFCLYMFYLVSLFLSPVVYLGLFVLFGWISLTAIIAILLTFPVLLVLKSTDVIQPGWNRVPFVIVPVSYIAARVFFMYSPIEDVKQFSLLVMVLSTLIVTIGLIKYKRTNRFKTVTKMKHMRVADGKKRTSKK
jgi:hypothetical protein